MILKLAVYLTILLIPLGVFSRIEIGENIAFYFNDILIPLIVSGWLFSSLLLKRKIYFPKAFFYLGIFLIIALISLLNASRFLSSIELTVSSMYLFRFVEYISLALLIANLFDKKSLENVINLLIFSSLALAFLGFVQYIVIPDFGHIAEEGGWDPHQYRVLSTFFDPNFLGLYFSFASLLVLVKLLSGQAKIRQLEGKLYFVSFLVLTLALILTYSRSSYLAFLTGFGLLGLLRWRWLLVLFPIVGIVVTLFFPRVLDRFSEGVGVGTSGEARLVEWQNALQVAKNNLVVGVGFNTYRYAQQEYGFKTQEAGGHSASGTDSSLLLVLATTGVLGLASFVLFLGNLFWSSLLMIRKKVPNGYVLMSSLFALLVHSLFVNSFFYPWLMEWFFIMLGVTLSEQIDD